MQENLESISFFYTAETNIIVHVVTNCHTDTSTEIRFTDYWYINLLLCFLQVIPDCINHYSSTHL
jgi:hypothetical protein